MKDKINGGVIMMGSLFWEDEKNCVEGKEKTGKSRRKWRERNLDITKTQSLPLPIRYGRFSGWDNRRNTYTMVISKEYLQNNTLGTSVIVPFKSKFDFHNKRTLNTQIKRLAKVEVISSEQYGKYRLAAPWGAVAIWINSESKQKEFLNNYWKKNIVSKTINQYADRDYNWSDGSLLNNDFQLQLDLKIKYDFLLCSYILPKYEDTDNDSDRGINLNKGYPSQKMIGDAISSSKYSTYFCQNRINKIITPDDEEIFKHTR